MITVIHERAYKNIIHLMRETEVYLEIEKLKELELNHEEIGDWLVVTLPAFFPEWVFLD